MNLKRVGLLASVVGAVLALTVATSPAFAKWAVHSNDATEMIAPDGGTEDQTCSDRLNGYAGWSTFVSPEEPAPVPLPDNAFDAVNYEVWKAPPGFTSFIDAQEQFDPNTGDSIGYSFFDTNGDPHPATQVKQFTTPPRVALAEPIPLNGGPPTGDQYVFTSAEFEEPLAGIATGDVLGLKPIGGSNFVSLAAIDCSPTDSYTFKGFYSPVNNPPTVNLGTAGKTYPLRFSLKDASGNPVSELSAISQVRTQRVFCSTFNGKPTDRLEVAVSGGTSLRYNAATGRFVYKWKTYSQGCFSLTVVLADDQEFPAFFRLR